jgi:hypothetical protein
MLVCKSDMLWGIKIACSLLVSWSTVTNSILQQVMNYGIPELNAVWSQQYNSPSTWFWNAQCPQKTQIYISITGKSISLDLYKYWHMVCFN